MNKKAISHVEVIISFVIFIGFLIFLFAIFPSSVIEKSQTGLDAAERGVSNFTNVEVNYISINLNSGASGDCFEIQINDNLFTDFPVIITDKNSDKIMGNRRGNSLDIKNSGVFYTIYSSSEFTENPVSGSCVNIDNYKIGLKNQFSAVSYSKLNLLKETYESDYSSLHDNFNMPKSENFGFILTEINGTEIMRGMRNQNGQVLARQIPVQIVYSNGDFKYAILNIQTW